MIKEIGAIQLKDMMDRKEDFQLIDVREQREYDFCNIGGKLIPLSQILSNRDKIREDKKVVFYCRSGKRSATAIKELQEKFNFSNLYNLKGGILSWSDEVDPSVPKY
jgi:adenylyltransferase/sulfurtransferase